MTGLLSEVVRTPTVPVNLASEMITLNDCNTVAFVSGSSTNESLDEGAELDEKGLHTWTKLGGVADVIKVGDIVGGATVSSVFAQHHSFAKRQLSSSGCVAVNYFVNGGDVQDGGEGSGGVGPPANGGIPPAGQLLVVCPQSPCAIAPCGAVTPTPTPTATPIQGSTATPTSTPTVTPTSTSTPTVTRTPAQVAVQVPTLGPWALALLGLVLAAGGLLFMKRK